MGAPESLFDARPIAALFVTKGGVYYGIDGVDPWDEERDARTYMGDLPVVAHPPCARWSRLAGFTEARYGYKRGEDGGCFAAALDAVKTYGKTTGGWTLSLLDGGASCYVEQGRYGLRVKKATWLYAYGVSNLPELRWGYTPDSEGEDGGGMDDWRKRVTYAEGSATPEAFRDELIAIARSSYLVCGHPRADLTSVDNYTFCSVCSVSGSAA